MGNSSCSFLLFKSLEKIRDISRIFKNFLQNDFSKVSSLLKSYFKFLKGFYGFYFKWVLNKSISTNCPRWFISSTFKLHGLVTKRANPYLHDLWLMEYESYLGIYILWFSKTRSWKTFSETLFLHGFCQNLFLPFRDPNPNLYQNFLFLFLTNKMSSHPSYENGKNEIRVVAHTRHNNETQTIKGNIFLLF